MNSNNNNINNTSSKPIKKMVLWTRINNCKSTSPHLKENSISQKKKIPKTCKSGKKENEHINLCQNEKKVLSPHIKSKDISNFGNNKNYLNYTRITTNKLLNSQCGSSQSNSNEDDKNISKNESSNKKTERDTNYINNIKYKKNMNIYYSPNATSNTTNINSNEFHINNTYKYFQPTNEIIIKKKENKTNYITNNNIIINQYKNSVSKKKISTIKATLEGISQQKQM